MRKMPALLTLIFLIGGCAQDLASRYYANEKYAPKPPSEVQLLWKTPDKKFVVIADFQSRGETQKT